MTNKRDPIVEAVRHKLLKRSQFGLGKYGIGLDRPDLSRLEWLVLAQEEAMDLCNYLEVLIQTEKAKGAAESQLRNLEIAEDWMQLHLQGVELERSRDKKLWYAIAGEEPFAGDGYWYRKAKK